MHPVIPLILVGAAVTSSLVTATRPGWLDRLRGRRVLLTGLAALGIVLGLTGAVISGQPDGNLHVWVLDVGHSHAVFIQSPNGAQVLVDGGRYPSRLLTALGQRMAFYDRHIDAVIVTHPDPFDISALPAVLRRYDVDHVLYHGQFNAGAEPGGDHGDSPSADNRGGADDRPRRWRVHRSTAPRQRASCRRWHRGCRYGAACDIRRYVVLAAV
ncbi:MAG: hypothetical protein HND48_07825 [Chloroflexi bacterium]|nr:hypothetical protein [Chloroflexota bacterium]